MLSAVGRPWVGRKQSPFTSERRQNKERWGTNKQKKKKNKKKKKKKKKKNVTYETTDAHTKKNWHRETALVVMCTVFVRPFVAELVAFLSFGCQCLRWLPRAFILISSQLFNLIYVSFLWCFTEGASMLAEQSICIFYFLQHLNLFGKINFSHIFDYTNVLPLILLS